MTITLSNGRKLNAPDEIINKQGPVLTNVERVHMYYDNVRIRFNHIEEFSERMIWVNVIDGYSYYSIENDNLFYSDMSIGN